MELCVHYLISNGGDGSASIRYFESRELACWLEDESGDEEYMWGESSYDSFTIYSDSIITTSVNITKKENVFLDLLNSYISYSIYKNSYHKSSLTNIVKFIDEFFGGSYPPLALSVKSSKEGDTILVVKINGVIIDSRRFKNDVHSYLTAEANRIKEYGPEKMEVLIDYSNESSD
jgi:hypothetical protein